MMFCRLENGSTKAKLYGVDERWLTQIVKLESKPGCDATNFSQEDDVPKTIRIRFVSSLNSNVYKGKISIFISIVIFLFLGEVDVDNMYVTDGSEGSLDVETTSDDKYTAAVESIDIPRNGSYLLFTQFTLLILI